MKRSITLAALIAVGLFSSTQAQAATETERFASLLRRAQKSPTPALAILTEFWREKNIDLSAAEIVAAAKLAQIDPMSELGLGLGTVDRITKSGKTVTFKRPTDSTLDMGDGVLYLGKTASFDISAGLVKNLGWSARKRLKNADAKYGYVHVDNVKGVKVGEPGGMSVNLYEFYYVKENDKPIIHGRGGALLISGWKRVEIPDTLNANKIGVAGRLASSAIED